MNDVSLPLAFLAGILSFLSPCVLPLLPSYVSFITGISFKDLTVGTDRARIRYLTAMNSLVFIAGFSTVFIALGVTSSVIGGFFLQHLDTIRIIGGIIIIFFGCFIAGFLKFDFLLKERKLYLSGKPAGYPGTFLVGMTFAAGWSPCIGPILGSILLYAGSTGSALYGLKLLIVYSIGFAIPFFLSSLGINIFISNTSWIAKRMRALMIISGAVLIIFGILLITDQIRVIGKILPGFGITL